MVRKEAILLLVLLPWVMGAQEVLVPAGMGAPTYQPVAKSRGGAVQLPFFDDFSHYTGSPDPALWQAGGGVVGTGFGHMPPTVGMLSLDALDATGRLYAHAATSASSADTVTSRPINLAGSTPADSVVFSFYYQPGGGVGNPWERMGDAPEGHDSLVLEFFIPSDSTWQPVWRSPGFTIDSLVRRIGYEWQYVALPLTDSRYFDSAFCFRFRNYCSLEDNGKTGMVGNADQWNIDYVLLDRHRTARATAVFRDVAFVSQAPTMLAHYRSMPARQYRPQEMASELKMVISNLYSSPFATHYSYAVLSATGDTLHRYDGGYDNITPYLPGGNYQQSPLHATPSVGYAFPQSASPQTYTVEHIVSSGAGGDERPQNDTLRYRQHFGYHYAYDDGSAENGYGLTSTADSVYLAYRFDLNEADTLTAVDIFFNSTAGDENLRIPFHITVWQAENGKPGTLLYRDATSRRAQTSGFNHFLLEHPALVSGSVFVGFSQVGNDYINIGFDRSFNTADRVYFLTANHWQGSILSGSLMLRPYFGMQGTLATPPVATVPQPLRLHPNPAHCVAVLSGVQEGDKVWLYDNMGRCLRTLAVQSAPFCLEVASLPAGIYLLRVASQRGAIRSATLLIQH